MQLKFEQLPFDELRKVIAALSDTEHLVFDLTIHEPVVKARKRQPKKHYTRKIIDGRTYITAGEASDILGVHYSTLERYALTGRLSYRTGTEPGEQGWRLYDLAEVEAFAFQREKLLIVR